MARLVFMGTSDFAVPVLQALAGHHGIAAVYTRADKPAGRGRRISVSPVKVTAEQLSLPLEQPRTLRTDQAEEKLRDLHPDLIIVAAYGLILPQAILNIPAHSSVNTHASLLPRWRGASPITAAILAGDDITGVTLMKMDAGVDTGPIIATRELTIERDDTTSSLSSRLSQLAASLLVDTLPDWLQGRITPAEQTGEPTLAGMVKKEQGLIDWTRPAVEIERQIRAFNPWPSAYTFWELPHQGASGSGKRLILKIWRASVSPETLHAIPGTVAVLAHGEIGVATGEGVLLLREVQLAGKRSMPIQEFARGHAGFVGSTLDR